jgi:hypothetical protein
MIERRLSQMVARARQICREQGSEALGRAARSKDVGAGSSGPGSVAADGSVRADLHGARTMVERIDGDTGDASSRQGASQREQVLFAAVDAVSKDDGGVTRRRWRRERHYGQRGNGPVAREGRRQGVIKRGRCRRWQAAIIPGEVAR